MFHIHKLLIIYLTKIDSTINLSAISAFWWYEFHITRSLICRAVITRLLDSFILISNLFRDDSVSDFFDQLDARDDVWIWIWIWIWIWVVIRFLLFSWRLIWIDHFRSLILRIYISCSSDISVRINSRSTRTFSRYYDRLTKYWDIEREKENDRDDSL
jgi:hypothetical protein